MLLLLLAPQSVTALDVTLLWGAAREPGLAGYRVFVRQEGERYNYRRPAWEGPETSCTIHNLDDETNYCFVARAFDTSGNVSRNSNEACTRYGISPSPCAGSAEASEFDTNPVYGPFDLLKLLACCLLLVGVVAFVRLWPKKK